MERNRYGFERQKDSKKGHHSFFKKILQHFFTYPPQWNLMSFLCLAVSQPSPPVQRRNIAVNLDDEYVVLSCAAVSCEDIVKIGKLLGVIE